MPTILDFTARATSRGLEVDSPDPQLGTFVVAPEQFGADLPPLLAGGAVVRLRESDVRPARWDASPPWRLTLSVERSPRAEADSPTHSLTGTLVRPAGETLSLDAPDALHPAGLLFHDGLVSRFDHGGAYDVALALRRFLRIPLADGELGELLQLVYSQPRGPAISLPPDVAITETLIAPRPTLSIVPDDAPWGAGQSVLTLGFEYGATRIDADSPRLRIFDGAALTLHPRDEAAERAAVERLRAAGAREETDPRSSTVRTVFPSYKLPGLILDLLRDGWRIDAQGKHYRTARETYAFVRSGIDWFDLDIEIDYGTARASLPAMLEALRKRRHTMVLSDGSIGVLPVEWLERVAPVLLAGTATKGATRFKRSQLALLDALVSSLPEVASDERFERARERLHSFTGVAALDPSPAFRGTLRAYQREGLGWLSFLRDFSLGGILADDMGLGKTVQVLAMLQRVHAAPPTERAHRRPSIIVVPRSLVFNWLREAERFTPDLRVVDYSGPRRRLDDILDTEIDVLVATYGTLRSDIVDLRAIEFEYAVLDEAQAIKNPDTASATAARLIRARHRLALSGTPIENRLEELWSIFEFLNPGMLGSSSAFAAIAELTRDAATPGGRPPGDGEPAGDGGAMDPLRRALRPVILRRTKRQVAPELPDRIEQTLEVRMEPAQREFYQTLLVATRRAVFDEIDRVGVGRAHIHILEALLRLRQAACHPVLVDHSRPNLPSAKLDALVPSITEIVAEGHKTIVFSQFTSFLSLVRRRLTDAGIAFEYLDGSTRDRAERVTRFQSDDGPPVFLISLMAGGHGLNLTAADYVYLLDPWWNPAVEAQAIDRAHRIGQTRHVIATRLVTCDTIEEKVLELQASKRALADSILGADPGGIGSLGRDDLELLLSS